jgi:hypothetical protein
MSEGVLSEYMTNNQTLLAGHASSCTLTIQSCDAMKWHGAKARHGHANAFQAGRMKIRRDCIARDLAAREYASGLREEMRDGAMSACARKPLQDFTMHRCRCRVLERGTGRKVPLRMLKRIMNRVQQYKAAGTRR